MLASRFYVIHVPSGRKMVTGYKVTGVKILPMAYFIAGKALYNTVTIGGGQPNQFRKGTIKFRLQDRPGVVFLSGH